MAAHKWTVAALTLSSLVGTAVAANLPRKSPEFAIQMNDGKQVLLSSYKGKVVALAFILTTCSHCQFATGTLSKLQTELGPRGFQVLESAVQENAGPAVPAFIQEFKPTFPVGFNVYQTAIDYLQHPVMQMMHMPALALIDRQGNIVAQYQGSDDFMAQEMQERNLRAKITSLLGTGGGAGKAPAKKTPATTKKGS